TVPPVNEAEELAMIQARAAKKDPVAIFYLGLKYCHGTIGLQKDMQRAVELWTEAAELGSSEALYNLGVAHDYGDGEGAQQDKVKSYECFKKAAMQGHAESRHNLGCCEWEKGNDGRAARHFLISAKMGHTESVEKMKMVFMEGTATKEQYAEALKGYQDAVEEMKSHDRSKYIEEESRRLTIGNLS
ncbi:hypothetical protein THAOC_20362, partial [Thalassiosira oceanica]